MPKGRGFLGCSRRTRQAHPKVKPCDRLTRALEPWLSVPLHRRRFPQALRYRGSLAHGEPERPSSPGLKSGVFWRRRIKRMRKLQLVAQGHSSKAIVYQLFISECAVALHLTAIFNKLGVNTRAQAAAVGVA